jgi:starvation-inducible DNA-binding protein
MARLTSVSEDEGAPQASEMIPQLVDAHEAVVRAAGAVVRAAEETGDAASLDLATRRLAVHEKTLWMLRASMSA